MSSDKSLEDVKAIFDNVPIAHLGKRIYTVPQPIKCKWCGSADIIRRGLRDGVQVYIC